MRAVVQLGDADASKAQRAALAEAVRAECRAKLSGPEVPRDVDFDEGLPRTETGKLARSEIRKRYWKGKGRRI